MTANPYMFDGDRPINNVEEDKLGFQPMAEQISRSILDFPSPDGLVMGIEGEWGSGKSSLVNLVADRLRQEIKVISFSPWMVKSRDRLMQEFFRDLGLAIRELADAELKASLEGQSGWRKKWKQWTQKDYSHLTEAFGDFAEGALELGAPLAGDYSDTAVGVGKLIKKWTSGGSLETRKSKLASALRKLDKKIVIIVDDLDRLEPKEAGEVLRLVRGVADFPNIIYLLCYDKGILLNSLKTAYQLDGDKAYLDKIVQVPFTLPMPESFTLRRMFRAELEKKFPTAFKGQSELQGNDSFQRLENVIGMRGGRALKTPRDIARCVNALRLYAGPVLGKIDFADAVWLQFIRLKNSALYSWIEDYVRETAAVSRGASMAEGEIKQARESLKLALASEQGTMSEIVHELEAFLPGIHQSLKAKDDELPFEVYKFKLRKWQADWVAGKRLASPQHYRLYFGLTKPQSAMDDDDYQIFLGLAENDHAEASRFFETHLGLDKDKGEITVSPILERISSSPTTIPSQAIAGILLSIADNMDLAAGRSGRGDWGRFWPWVDAENIFRSLMERLEGEERETVIQTVFSNGRAIAWLCNMLRSEVFAHGKVESRPANLDDKKMLTETEYETVIQIMHQRLRNLTQESLLSASDLPSILYFWLQSSDAEDEIKDSITNLVRSDADMLRFLDKMRGWRSSSAIGIYHPILRSVIKHFSDFDSLKNRVKEIATSEAHPLKAHAANVLQGIVQGSEDDELEEASKAA